MPTQRPAEPDRTDSALSPLVLRARAGAMAEDVATRAATWRDASQRERAAAFAGLVRIAEYGARHRPKPYAKPPLKFPRFSSLKPHDAAR